jgi:hypothetical protein
MANNAANMAGVTDFLQPVSATIEALLPHNVGTSAAINYNPSGLKQTVTAYYFADGMTDREKRCVLAALTLCGRAADIRPDSWQSFVLTWSFCCLPDLVSVCRNDTTIVDYVFEPFSREFIDSCVEAVMAQAVEETAGEKYLYFPAHLPNASTVAMTPDIVDASQVEGLYAYYAMIIFIMGKSLSPTNIAAISKNRPDALMRKRTLEASRYILTGEGKIDPGNYRFVQSGWIRSTRPRIAIVQQLAKLNASEGRSEIFDSISVNMDMLKNSGQSYVYYINELLIACPWCLHIPALRSSYAYYVRMVNVIASHPVSFQPFYKLAMQDAAKTVRRRDVEALIGVSTFYAAQTRKSMNLYRVSEGILPVVKAFRLLAESHGIVFEDIANQQVTDTTAV